MAEKQLHTINLRSAKRIPSSQRAGRAIRKIKEYVSRHTNAADIKISNAVNEHVWGRSISKPPKNVNVQVVTEDDTAYVEMADRDFEIPAPAAPEPAATTDVTDEELAEHNVDEVKDLVRDGAVDAQRALDVELAGKNRKTLIDWLEGRLDSGDEEETVEEDSEETYDLPEDVLDVFRDGTIGEGKDAAKELNKSEFEKLLNFEEAHQNRKGMKQWLQSNMN